YQVDIGFALCVAHHESRFSSGAVGDDGAAVGLYQFWLPTWRMFRRQMGLPTEDWRTSQEESIKTALWAFAHGYRLHWAVVKKGLCP
ncbi:MAG: transglycosylase SLT domain-containing protein, partial [Chloroflexi bacterium]|nr:transglycosylase SLT domain-containing protein [Chloroflexota bacterium]